MRRIRLSFSNRFTVGMKLVQPLFWLLVIGTTFNALIGSVSGGNKLLGADYLSFMALGVASMTVILTSLNSGMTLVLDREIGTLRIFLVAPIARSTIVIGNALGVAVEGLAQSIIVLFLAVLIGARFNITLVSIMIYCLVSIFLAIGLYSLMALLGSRMKNTQSFMTLSGLLTIPLYFVSGSIYPVGYLPYGLEQFAVVSPITHVVAVMRFFLLGAQSSNLNAIWQGLNLHSVQLEAALSLAYIVAFTMVCLFLSTLSMSKSRL